MSASVEAGPHSRRFGVEIECGLPGGTRHARELFEFQPDSPYFNKDGWCVDSDGSGVELKTPILQGEEGYEKVHWAMEKLKDAGAFVTTADGLHIHHDAPEFVNNLHKCLQLVQSWRNNEQLIFEMVAPRRRNGPPCPAWDNWAFTHLRDLLEGEDDYFETGRFDLNISSLADHGTIEIRLHEGTLDADVAIAWIKFGQCFIHDALQSSQAMRASKTDATLLSRIRLSPEAQAILAAKKSENYITAGSKFRSHNY